jgi:hypothetical protein
LVTLGAEELADANETLLMSSAMRKELFIIGGARNEVKKGSGR